MSKRVVRRRKKTGIKQQRTGRRKLVITVCLPLCLLLAVITVARWSAPLGMIKPATPPPPGNFNANSPSKEYIYSGGRLIATEESTSTSAPPAPTTFRANAQYLPVKVQLSWDAPAVSFNHYRVERKQAGTDYITINSSLASTATNFDDSQVESNKAYLYRICAVAGSQSTCSEPDLTTTVPLLDYPFLAGSLPLIKAQHFLDLMVAVNAARELAGPTQPQITWSTENPAPVSGGAMYASHFNDLRNGLAGALNTLGLTGTRYSLPAEATKGNVITATPMQSLQEIVR